jgi:hypothetical protein
MGRVGNRFKQPVCLNRYPCDQAVVLQKAVERVLIGPRSYAWWQARRFARDFEGI